MNMKLYWKNRIPFFILNVLCMLALSLFLGITGNPPDAVALILLVWILLLICGTAAACYRRRKELEELLRMTEEMPQRYLIPEVMKSPGRAEDQVFYRILKLAEKSMLEEIGAVMQERGEYREYIEQWIHEIKTPITAMRLLCENNRSPLMRELLVQLEKTDGYTQQALYYARSEHTEKDCSIHEIALSDVIHQSIYDNKYLLRQEHVAVKVEESGRTVFSDEKWLRFILNQLIVNAVKYRSEKPVLEFHTELKNSSVLLYLSDNGIGIPESDLPQICEKGFTGQNGRLRQGSTGIGLYLCRRLCGRLGIGLEILSEGTGTGTTAVLSFYMNEFVYQVQE